MPPNVIEVLPNVVALFANCALVIPALLVRLLVVKPSTEIVPPLIEIPDPAVNAVCFVLIAFVLAVILVVFDVILVSNPLSAFVALVVSAVILVVFDVILVSNALSAFVALVVSAVMLDVFAATEVGKPAIVEELIPPTVFTVVAKLPLPDPVISPVKVVVAFAAITLAPITKPKFVLASAAVVAPVPPLAIAIAPLILAEVKLLSATPAFALCKST